MEEYYNQLLISTEIEDIEVSLSHSRSDLD